MGMAAAALRAALASIDTHAQHLSATGAALVAAPLPVSRHPRRAGGATERDRPEITRSERRVHPHSGINANVHNEPPVGTLACTKRGATAPPNPEATDTYWRPLCV
jgi:hypothetical protein